MKSIKHAILSAALATAIGAPSISFAATPKANAPAVQTSATYVKNTSAEHATQKKHKKKKIAAAKASASGLKSPVNAAPKR